MLETHHVVSRNRSRNCYLPQGKHLCGRAYKLLYFPDLFFFHFNLLVIYLFIELVACKCSAHCRPEALLQAP